MVTTDCVRHTAQLMYAVALDRKVANLRGDTSSHGVFLRVLRADVYVLKGSFPEPNDGYSAPPAPGVIFDMFRTWLSLLRGCFGPGSV